MGQKYVSGYLKGDANPLTYSVTSDVKTTTTTTTTTKNEQRNNQIKTTNTS